MCWRAFHQDGKRCTSAAPLPACLGAGAHGNVILIVWDTVRAYDVSSYGFSREATPNLSRWAKEGVQFNLRAGGGPVDISLAYELLHRPVAQETEFAVEVHAGYARPHARGVSDIAGLSDCRIRRQYKLLHLRIRAVARILSLRGLCPHPTVTAYPDGSREMDAAQSSGLRRLIPAGVQLVLRKEVAEPRIPRRTRAQRTVSQLAQPSPERPALLRVSELFRRPRAVHSAARLRKRIRNKAQVSRGIPLPFRLCGGKQARFASLEI